MTSEANCEVIGGLLHPFCKESSNFVMSFVMVMVVMVVLYMCIQAFFIKALGLLTEIICRSSISLTCMQDLWVFSQAHSQLKQ